MNLAKRDLIIYPSLSIVAITGFEPEKIETDDGLNYADNGVDPIGSANYLAEAYGMSSEDAEEDEPGILWTDYEGEGWTFNLLIASDEIDSLKKTCEEAGYSFDGAEEITEPTNFGDGGGTVEILKHRDGWVLVK